MKLKKILEQISQSNLINRNDHNIIELGHLTANIGYDLRYGDVINVYYHKLQKHVIIEYHSFGPSGGMDGASSQRLVNNEEAIVINQLKPNIILSAIKSLFTSVIRSGKPTQKFYWCIYSGAQRKIVYGLNLQIIQKSLESVQTYE